MCERRQPTPGSRPRPSSELSSDCQRLAAVATSFTAIKVRQCWSYLLPAPRPVIDRFLMNALPNDPRVWLGGKDAGLYIGRSRDAVEKRAIPWCEQYVDKKVRYKLLQMDTGGEAERRYFKPDLDKWLLIPPGGSNGDRTIKAQHDATNHSGYRKGCSGENVGEAPSSEAQDRIAENIIFKGILSGLRKLLSDALGGLGRRQSRPDDNITATEIRTILVRKTTVGSTPLVQPHAAGLLIVAPPSLAKSGSELPNDLCGCEEWIPAPQLTFLLTAKTMPLIFCRYCYSFYCKVVAHLVAGHISEAGRHQHMVTSSGFCCNYTLQGSLFVDAHAPLSPPKAALALTLADSFVPTCGCPHQRSQHRALFSVGEAIKDSRPSGSEALTASSLREDFAILAPPPQSAPPELRSNKNL